MGATLIKVKEYLSSSDREMIELGAQILTSYPKCIWKKVMKDSLNKRFRCEIEEDVINIFPIWSGKGLYEQLNNNYRAVYNREAFSIDLLTKTLNKYYDKDQQRS